MSSIDFWFSIGSTYSFLTVMRLETVEKASGVAFSWRPFSVRALMQEMDNIPFVGKPAKEKYMWRDIERRATRHGLPVQFPVDYPLRDFDLANRIAVVAAEEGWCPDYARATYRLWFQEGLPAGGDANIERSVREAGHSPERVVDAANSATIEKAYRDATHEARSLGVFGSPSFLVDGRELFWGDDRLEDAVDWSLNAAADD